MDYGFNICNCLERNYISGNTEILGISCALRCRNAEICKIHSIIRCSNSKSRACDLLVICILLFDSDVCSVHLIKDDNGIGTFVCIFFDKTDFIGIVRICI